MERPSLKANLLKTWWFLGIFIQIFLLSIKFPEINASENITLFTCCDFQSTFINGSCLNRESSGLSISFPEEDFSLLTTKFEFSLQLVLRDYLLCPYGSEVLNVSLNTTDNKKQLDISKNGELLTVSNFLHSKQDFCVNSVTDENLEVIVCKQKCSSVTPCVPICCGDSRPRNFSFLGNCHSNPTPDVNTYNSESFFQTLINANNTFDLNEEANLYISRLPCMKYGQTFATKIVYNFNEIITNESYSETPDSFCLAGIHNNKNNVQYFETLYCGEKWPYEEFGLSDIERPLYGICSSLSIIFTVLAILIYLSLRKKQSIHTWTQCCYVITLLGTYITIVLAIYLPTDPNYLCGIETFILKSVYNFFGLATLSWLAILSFDLFLSFWRLKPTVGQNRGSFRRLYIYLSIGWTYPLLVVMGVILANTKNWKRPPGYCLQIKGKFGELAGVIVVLLNIGFFIATFVMIIKHRKNAQFATQTASKKKNQLYSLFAKLFLLTGITFSGVIVEMISQSKLNRSSIPLLAFRTLICLQGIVVFVVYLCNKKIWNQLVKEYPTLKPLESFKLSSFSNRTTPITTARSDSSIKRDAYRPSN